MYPVNIWIAVNTSICIWFQTISYLAGTCCDRMLLWVCFHVNCIGGVLTRWRIAEYICVGELRHHWSRLSLCSILATKLCEIWINVYQCLMRKTESKISYVKVGDFVLHSVCYQRHLQTFCVRVHGKPFKTIYKLWFINLVISNSSASRHFPMI